MALRQLSLHRLKMSRKKRKFSMAERYAVWISHGQRCWICAAPNLRLQDTTIDHVLPESLLDDPERLKSLLASFGLPLHFQINGFENWLPAHASCNHYKHKEQIKVTPANEILLGRLFRSAPDAARLAEKIQRNVDKDRIFSKLLVAIDRHEISVIDIVDVLERMNVQVSPSDAFIKMDNGYWMRKSEIAAEGPCTCERPACVGHGGKVYCYWTTDLSAWAIVKRLYKRCYDEQITCKLCDGVHARGLIGWAEVCFVKLQVGTS